MALLLVGHCGWLVAEVSPSLPDLRRVHQPGMHGFVQAVPSGIPWTHQEDMLLSAIVHEFGCNWQLVSEVLSTSSSSLGIFRRPDACAARFKQFAARVGEIWSV
jgi:Myb-like DNA-binding domain